ncbi:Ubiquitin carboxyl-terminal hydrolase 12 [Astathelohania contejeani]|uniref:Ubiquitin carboxyl-terminal hydrolase 12 n=1 Tax=Astathelohania contejeani TaxID=164912 RepID=A0ABQ7HW45_9MICR|nr:Ubiquitin carboxyl-terminal hydrolase 12 [Thelohania contejeani]
MCTINAGDLKKQIKQEEVFGNYLLPVGIPNIANTCYANSSLQALLSLKSFLNYFEQSYNGDLFASIKNLIKNVRENISPGKKDMKNYISLIRKPIKDGFNDGNQECASEFI